MNCETSRELLSVRLDGALTAAEETALREHLETCAECRSHAAGLEAVVGLVRKIPAPVPDRSLAADVVARLPRRRRPAPIKWLVPLAAAACLLIVARLTLLDSQQVERGLEVASRSGDPSDAGPPAPVAEADRAPDAHLGAEGGSGAWTKAADRPAPPAAAPRDVIDPAADSGAAPDDDVGVGFGGGASGAGLAGAPPAGNAGLSEGRAASRDFRTYAVSGAEPDAAAGVILAELRSRRSREREEDEVASGEARVVQDRSGDVAGMILTLTPAEIEFVTCLLEERPGVRVDRVNGSGKKRDRGAEKEEVDADGGDDAVVRRVRVRLDFAGR